MQGFGRKYFDEISFYEVLQLYVVQEGEDVIKFAGNKF